MKYILVLLSGLFLAACSQDFQLPVKHSVSAKHDKLVFSPKKPDRFLSKDGVVYKCFR